MNRNGIMESKKNSRKNLDKAQKEFISIIRKKCWNEAIKVSEFIIPKLMEMNYTLKRHTNTECFLHLACMLRAPSKVIEAFLMSLKCCNKAEDMLQMTDASGWTPLHLSILYGMENEAVLVLIRACKVVVSMRNSYGWTPLLLALRYGASTMIVQALLGADTTTASISNMSGISPLQMRWSSWENFKKKQSSGIRKSSAQESTEYSKDMWNQMLFILKALTFHGQLAAGEELCGNNPFDDWENWYKQLLHSAIKHFAPLDFIRFAMRQHPDHLSYQDKDGRTPLSITCTAFGSNEKDEYYITLIQEISSKCPEAAKMKDSLDHYPINTLLRKGACWSSGVESLVHAAPDLLETKCISSGLYPFMAAAPLSSDDTIFNLLRASPCRIES